MATKTLSFVEAIKACFSKFATFSGRARRSEFWWFYLLGLIPNWIIGFMANWKMGKAAALESELYSAAFSGGDTSAIMAQAESVDTTFYVVVGICGIISLILLIPTLAVWVRRLHDVGKSGHMLWLILLCGIGGLIPLLMCIADGKPEPNQYGPSPKFAAAPMGPQAPPAI